MKIKRAGKYNIQTTNVRNGMDVSFDFEVTNQESGLFVMFGAGVSPIRVDEIRQDCVIKFIEE